MRTMLTSLIAALFAFTALFTNIEASATQSFAVVGSTAFNAPAPQTDQATTRVAGAETEPYWRRASAVCSAGVCRVDYPRIAVGRRLDIQFVSCFATSDQPGFGLGIPFLGVNDAFAANGERHVILWNVRTSFGSTVGEISQPILMTVSAGQRAEIGFALDGASTADSQCTITGELLFLK